MEGIDRVDSNKPYVKENCVPCCYTCNIHKFTFSQNGFLEKCLAITCKKITFIINQRLQKIMNKN